MAQQYDRRYELIVTPIGEPSRIITELRVSFRIQKSTISYPNIAQITLYNPAPDTLAALQKRYTLITLSVGYGDNIRQVFQGQIRNVTQGKTNVDRTIVVYAGDGDQDWNNAVINKTYSENISVQDIVTELITEMANSVTGVILGLPNDKDKIRGQTLSGPVRDQMDLYANEYGFEWSIQDGQVMVIPDGVTLPTATRVIVTAGTGMLDSPKLTEVGVSIRTLLDVRLMPYALFAVEATGVEVELGDLVFRDIGTRTIEGDYRVQEVIFIGDSYDGDWTSEAKGISL